MKFSLYFDKGTLLLFGPKEIILSNFDDFVWDDLEAYGRTDLGAAIRLLSAL